MAADRTFALGAPLGVHEGLPIALAHGLGPEAQPYVVLLGGPVCPVPAEARHFLPLIAGPIEGPSGTLHAYAHHPGGLLAEAVRTAPLPPKASLEVGAAIAAALVEADTHPVPVPVPTAVHVSQDGTCRWMPIGAPAAPAAVHQGLGFLLLDLFDGASATEDKRAPVAVRGRLDQLWSRWRGDHAATLQLIQDLVLPPDAGPLPLTQVAQTLAHMAGRATGPTLEAWASAHRPGPSGPAPDPAPLVGEAPPTRSKGPLIAAVLVLGLVVLLVLALILAAAIGAMAVAA